MSMFLPQSHRIRNQSLVYQLEKGLMIPGNDKGSLINHNNHPNKITPRRFCSVIVSPPLQRNQCSSPFLDVNRLKIQQQNSHNIMNAGSRTIQKIKEIAPIHISNALYMLQQCLILCQTKIKRQGQVMIDISEIRITKQGKISPQIHSAWIAVNLSPNSINQLKIVRLLVQQTLVLSDESFIDFDKFFMRSCHKLNLNFKGAIKLIKAYSSCAKIQLQGFYAIRNQERIKTSRVPKRSPSTYLRFFQTNETDCRPNKTKKPSFFKHRESHDSLTPNQINKRSSQFHAIIKSKQKNQQIRNFNKSSMTSALTKDNNETNTSSQINESEGHVEQGLKNLNTGSSAKKFRSFNLASQTSHNFTYNLTALLRNHQISEVVSEYESSTERSYPEDFNTLAFGIQGNTLLNKTIWTNETSMTSRKKVTNKIQTRLNHQSSWTGYNNKNSEQIPREEQQNFQQKPPSKINYQIPIDHLLNVD